MKPNLFFQFAILASIILISSCKKENDSNPMTDYVTIENTCGIIGAGGGEIIIPESNTDLAGVIIQIPAGALIDPIDICITRSDIDLILGDLLVEFFEIKPSDIKFIKPISITLPLNMDSLNDKSIIHYYDPEEHIETIKTTEISSSGITIESSRFGLYGIAPAENILNAPSKIYNCNDEIGIRSIIENELELLPMKSNSDFENINDLFTDQNEDLVYVSFDFTYLIEESFLWKGIGNSCLTFIIDSPATQPFYDLIHVYESNHSINNYASIFEFNEENKFTKIGKLSMSKQDFKDLCMKGTLSHALITEEKLVSWNNEYTIEEIKNNIISTSVSWHVGTISGICPAENLTYTSRKVESKLFTCTPSIEYQSFSDPTIETISNDLNLNGISDGYEISESNNTAPHANFTLSEDSGTIDTVFVFDASSSYDNEDPTCALMLRWDFENDGIWDTEWMKEKNISHQYNNEGTYIVKLAVRDSQNMIDHHTKYVSINFPTSFFTDPRDGKVYKIVEIGNQTWFAQNLNRWIGSFWCYDFYGSNCDTYGKLYDWETANEACPKGWHLPSDEDWKTLETNLGIDQFEIDDTGWRGTDQGVQMKATYSWNYDGNGSNSSGFNALAGGWRYNDGGGSEFNDLGETTMWWSSTDYEYDDSYVWFRKLARGGDAVLRGYFEKDQGLSVRCIKD